MKKTFSLLLFSIVLPAQEKVDLAVIQRIKKEAFQNSKVMDHLFYLTDVYGPRVTGSPPLHGGGELGGQTAQGIRHCRCRRTALGQIWKKLAADQVQHFTSGAGIRTTDWLPAGLVRGYEGAGGGCTGAGYPQDY